MVLLRLKVLRKQEERINKVKDMMDNWYSIKVPSIPTYNYQPVGGSSFSVTENIDPKIAKTRELWHMFHADR